MIADFTKLKLNDEAPIYLQIIRFVKIEIAAGNLSNADEMPSRRVLSSMLCVNPNTIQKAYRILEEEELIVSYAGAKSELRLSDEKIKAVREELIEHETLQYISSVRQIGLTKEDAIEAVLRLWAALE